MRKLSKKINVFVTVLLPLFLFMFISSCVSTNYVGDEVVAIAPTKMNVLYIGVDNPIVVAVSGHDYKSVKIGIDNGSIKGENGKYFARVKKIGTVNISVLFNGDTISNQLFRVKRVPDPVAMIAGTSGGELTKEIILNANKIECVIPNFDFDLKFEITSFVVSATIGGYVEEAKSNTGKFTAQQINLLNKLKAGKNIYFESIMAKGPDGVTRKLSSIEITLTE